MGARVGAALSTPFGRGLGGRPMSSPLFVASMGANCGPPTCPVPLGKIVKQLVVLCRRLHCWLLLRGEKCREVRPVRQPRWTVAIDPGLRRLEPREPRQLGRQIDITPLAVVRSVLELGYPGGKALNKLVEPPVGIGVRRPFMRNENGPDRDRVDTLAGLDDLWIVLMGERGGKV